jgi:DUF4097 and DUF4098 domain-containing protein YvlB
VDIVATGSARFIDREEKRFAVSGRPNVTLSTFDGSIEVRPWDRAEVLVEIEKYAPSQEAAADIEVLAQQNGDTINLDVRVRKGAHHIGFHFNRSARLVVSVPASSDLQATSGDGSIDVERLAGAIELRSGDGSISGRDLSGEVRAQTGDGSVRLEDVAGTLDIGTGDGSIVATGQLSAVRARSGDGSVTVRAERGSTAREDWNISTGDGSVTLELPDGFDAELDAHTGDGTVSVRDDALSDVVESRRRSVRGRLGAGGRSIRVRSGDGTITLRRS